MTGFRHLYFAAVASTALSGAALAGPSFQYIPGSFPAIGDELSLNFQGYTVENSGVTLGDSGGLETTWGMGTVTGIFDQTTGGPAIWNGSGLNPQNTSMDFIIYGIADQSVSGTPPALQLDNIGCTSGAGNNGTQFSGCDGNIHVDFYLVQGNDPALSNSTTPASRTGFGTVAGISNVGTLFMQWDLTPSDLNDNGDNTTTLYQDVNADSLPTTGVGDLLANCVSGPGCMYFGGQSETLNALTGLYADFEANFTLQTPSNNASTFQNGFPGKIAGQALTESEAPEPGSLALIGSGLVGLFGIASRARRKRS